MLRSVCLDLRPVDGHVAQLHQPRLLAKQQHLHEQPSERREVLLAKSRYAVMVGMLIARENSKRHILVRRLFDLPRRRLAHAVAVDQQLDHHRRVIPGATPIVLLPVRIEDRRQIQAIHHVRDEQREVSLRHPLPQVRWQQQPLIQVVRQESLGHTPTLRTPPDLLLFSDTLLVHPSTTRAREMAKLLPGTGIKSGGIVEANRPGGHWGYRQDSFLADVFSRSLTGLVGRSLSRSPTPDGLFRGCTYIH